VDVGMTIFILGGGVSSFRNYRCSKIFCLLKAKWVTLSGDRSCVEASTRPVLLLATSPLTPRPIHTMTGERVTAYNPTHGLIVASIASLLPAVDHRRSLTSYSRRWPSPPFDSLQPNSMPPLAIGPRSATTHRLSAAVIIAAWPAQHRDKIRGIG
jgi:hypothetical protein